MYSFSTGCSASVKSHQIYDCLERNHAIFCTWVVKLLCGIVTTVYVSSGMQPILYALFGHPSPQHWTLPFEIRYVAYVVCAEICESYVDTGHGPCSKGGGRGGCYGEVFKGPIEGSRGGGIKNTQGRSKGGFGHISSGPVEDLRGRGLPALARMQIPIQPMCESIFSKNTSNSYLSRIP